MNPIEAQRLKDRAREAGIRADWTGLPHRFGTSLNYPPGRSECTVVFWYNWPEAEEEFTDAAEAKAWLDRHLSGGMLE